jgi:hypothetical protein
MRDTIEMAREAWAKAGEGWVDQNWYLDREKAFKELEALVRADEREALQAEVLEQCRIIAMGAEREDALRAELTRLKASIALDKMAENARELGLDYEPAVQEGRDWSLLEATQESLREHMAEIKRLKAAQPAPVQEPVAEVKAKMTGGNVGIATVIHEIYSPHREPLQPGDKLYAGHRWMGWDIEQVWSERIFGIDMRFENVQDAIKFRAKLDESTPPAPQPVPVQHDECVVCGDKVRVIPRPWVGLTETEILPDGDSVVYSYDGLIQFARAIEAKLKEKNQ